MPKTVKLFSSVAAKLSLRYLAIIMVLSIGMSFALYHVSSNDLDRDAFGQMGYFNSLLNPDNFNNYTQLRYDQLQKDRDHLKANLILFNVLVLMVGGIVSYELARRTLEPIEESHEAQKRFAGDASHELRTPLTAMQTEIEVALRDPKLTKADAVKLLQSNLEEVGKLRSLSDGLLKLTSADGNGIALKPVNLKTAIDQAIEQNQQAAQAKRIKIISQLDSSRVKGDLQSLTQLISILLDNAIKYSAAGKEVKISLTHHDRTATLSVSDQGQGIEQVDLPKIFERFYRADSSRSKQINGYGLGLALAKQIAKNHQASMEVSSTPGKGSTFTVHLPLV